MMFVISDPIKEIAKDLKVIKESAIPKAAVQALNRTATGTKTDGVREVAKATSLKQSDVRKEIKGPSDLFKYKATKNRQIARVNASTGRAANLIKSVTPSARKPNHFNEARTLKSGKRKYRAKGVRARAWGKTKTYDGTFIGTGKGSSAALVFARTSSKRKPLKSISGPSIRETFDSKPMQAKLKSMASVRFQKNMTAAVNNQIRLALK